jgi:hypothetical protein
MGSCSQRSDLYFLNFIGPKNEDGKYARWTDDEATELMRACVHYMQRKGTVKWARISPKLAKIGIHKEAKDCNNKYQYMRRIYSKTVVKYGGIHPNADDEQVQLINASFIYQNARLK